MNVENNRAASVSEALEDTIAKTDRYISFPQFTSFRTEAINCGKSGIGVEQFFSLFFCLDTKEPKNQGLHRPLSHMPSLVPSIPAVAGFYLPRFVCFEIGRAHV